MIYEFSNDQEQEFQQCIAENDGCCSQRFADRLVVLTGADIPQEPQQEPQQE